MPFKSEAQRKLAYAAKAGKSDKMSEKTAEKLIKHDTGGKLPEKVTPKTQSKK